ncbi:hypothetical protein T459_35361 [Capsicum annuum]|uniref:Uncharacterized protein n=1 Tax=Capsicum annuum TaxID=4072 RepID=A0A2G2XTH0_CAPAN|nr:hypothetical protein T459_35361 [Capsicum annuum]
MKQIGGGLFTATSLGCVHRIIHKVGLELYLEVEFSASEGQAPEGSSQAHIQFSSLSPLLSARDTIRSKREVSTQQNYTAVLGLDFTLKGDGSSMSSHLILKDPLEEPQGLEKPPTETRTRSSVESLVIVNCLETLMLGSVLTDILDADDILYASVVSSMSTDILDANDILDASIVSSVSTDIE